MSAIWIEVTATRGSAPRDAGTVMKVTAHGIAGTIGGGALEKDAIATARDLLQRPGGDTTRHVALGPGLGQCCGGAVSLRFTRTDMSDRLDPDLRRPAAGSPCPEDIDLWIWGAGHVGRAVVAALPPGAARITWIDASADRFPDWPASAALTMLPAADMPRLAASAPAGAHHLIFTYSHDIDLALCAALLTGRAGSIGLIGSATKKARFFKRLSASGLDPSSIICPIGDPALGKAPADIARGIAAGFRKDIAA